MDTPNFIGLSLRITHHDGSSVEGVVAAIDVNRGSITLSPATVVPVKIPSFKVPSKTVLRSDIAALLLVSLAPSPNSSEAALSNTASPLSHSNHQGTPSSSIYGKPATHASEDLQEITNPAQGQQSTLPLQPTKGKQSKNKNAKKNLANELSPQRSPPPKLASSYTQDFDFVGSSAKFNKAAVFAQIQSQDKTDPAQRLVAHNKNKHIARLSTHDHVLSDVERARNTKDLEDALQLFKPAPVAQSPTSPPPAESLQHKQSLASLQSHNRNNLSPNYLHNDPVYMNEQGVRAPEVRLKQFNEVISIAEIDTGPSLLQRAECVGMSISHYIFNFIGRTQDMFVIAPRSPSIVIVVDECEKGVLALRAGVHLINHGARVSVFLTAPTPVPHGTFAACLRVFSSAGGRIVRALEDLEDHYNLIIDAMSDNEVQSTFSTKSPRTLSCINWVMGSGIPIMCIDCPMGADHDTGLPLLTPYIKPDYIVCQGAVRTGCRAHTAEVAVIDAGLPPSLWNRVRVDWDTKFFAGLFAVTVTKSNDQ